MVFLERSGGVSVSDVKHHIYGFPVRGVGCDPQYSILVRNLSHEAPVLGVSRELISILILLESRYLVRGMYVCTRLSCCEHFVNMCLTVEQGHGKGHGLMQWKMMCDDHAV